MAIDFPASPTNGQTFTSGSVTYTWDGTKWTAVAAAGSSNSISQGNTNATVTDTGSDGRFVVTTEGSERLRVTSAGLVGVGTATPSNALEVNGNIRTYTAAAGDVSITHAGLVSSITAAGSISLALGTNNTERARIDTSGRLLVGTTNSAGSQLLKVNGSTSGSTFGGTVSLTQGRTAPPNGSTHGVINFGSETRPDGGASIAAIADGAWTDGSSHPSALIISTTASGASSPTERMRITQQGELLVGVQNPTGNSYAFVKADSNTCYIADRINSDGDLFLFRQAGTQEGSISVSGTTVSYNGAHLSRWSQLPGGVERTEILRGTVLSNIDEMCEWGDEENEQLNRMKVSDVEGDKNVSGVFQCWDDDDDTYTNDFYCAMTGDFIIRIAQGVTVARGDLLMSAGDGTAKPQDDDIIRSKTIAKVTSTSVSCTYGDGSYCVPCVLMAC